MSIKEALNKDSNIYDGSIDIIPNVREFLAKEKEEAQQRNFYKGIALLKAIGIPKMLEELADAIKTDYPDAVVTNPFFGVPGHDKRYSDPIFNYWADGITSIMLCWDFKDEPRRKYSTFKKREGVKFFNILAINVLPEKRLLFIQPWNKDGLVFSTGCLSNRPGYAPVDSPAGQKERELLEKAIVEAYKNPGHTSNEICCV